MGKTEQVWWPRSSQGVLLLLLLPTAAALLEAPSAEELSAEENVDFVQPVLDTVPGTVNRLLNLYAFDIHLRLDLHPDHSFLAPSFTFQTVGSRPGAKALHPEPIDDLKGCFYSGTVNGDWSLTATLNLCNGVFGIFHLQDETFFIQPAERKHLESLAPLKAKKGQFEQLQWHVVQRRRVGEGGGSRCGVLADEIRVINRAGAQRPEQNWVPGRARRSTGTRRIIKRSGVSSTYSVETMLVADESMVKFHGSGIKQYLLTLFSSAARIYKLLGGWNFIDLVVVKVLTIDEKAKGPEVTCSSALTLQNFCKWQQQHNPPSDQDAEHYDAVILFTRQDLCTSLKCNILGRAFSGTICDPGRSCAIVKDNGLQAAFTIAHELGHLLNIPHDDAVQCAGLRDVKDNMRVMSPSITNLNLKRPWSFCSSHMIVSFLSNGHGKCLMDKPQKSLELHTDLPGILYDADQQCVFHHGWAHKHCHHAATTCKKLWCIATSSGPSVCKPTISRWADGTKCADNKWCIQGECVDKNKTVPTPVHGMWGTWEPWTNCSRTCGGGVRNRTRKCDNPVPKNGGESCEGLKALYRSCNLNDCPYNKGKTFREEQCEAYNNVSMSHFGNGSAIQWIPRFAGVNPKDWCQLVCEVKGLNVFAILHPMVVDGTPCHPNSTSICVQGKCIEAGCDGVLFSQKTFDKCGICGGNGSTCKKIIEIVKPN